MRFVSDYLPKWHELCEFDHFLFLVQHSGLLFPVSQQENQPKPFTMM